MTKSDQELRDKLASEHCGPNPHKAPTWPVRRKAFQAGWDARQTQVDELRAENDRLRKLRKADEDAFNKTIDGYEGRLKDSEGDWKRIQDAERERDQLRKEVERLRAENAKLKAAHEYLSTTDMKAIGDIIIERDKLRAELARLQDTPGGKRLYAQMNEIDKLRTQIDEYIKTIKLQGEEVERLKTEAKALKGNWAGTWINECELNDLLKDRDRLTSLAELMADSIEVCIHGGFTEDLCEKLESDLYKWKASKEGK
jgi:chromosome segregation ATPase